MCQCDCAQRCLTSTACHGSGAQLSQRMLAQPSYLNRDFYSAVCSGCCCLAGNQGFGCLDKLLPAVVWESSLVIVSPGEHGLTVRGLETHAMAGCLELMAATLIKLKIFETVPRCLGQYISVVSSADTGVPQESICMLHHSSNHLSAEVGAAPVCRCCFDSR